MFNLFEDKKSAVEKKNLVLSETELARLNNQIQSIKEISNTIAGISDIDKVLEFTVKQLVRSWGMKMPSIYLLNDDKTILSLRGFDAPQAVVKIVENAVGGKVDQFVKYSLEKDDQNVLVQSIKQKKILYANSLGEFISPLVSIQVAGLLQSLMRLKVMLAVPLIVKSEVIGVMAVSSIDEKITDLDRDGIEAIANQIAIAIYNATLFTKVQSQVTQLEIQNHDLSSLYNLTSQISKSLDPEEVAQTAVNSLPQDQLILGAVLTSYNEETGDSMFQALTETQISYQVEKVIGSFNKYGINIKDIKNLDLYKNNPVYKAITYDSIQMSNEFANFLYPPIPKQLAGLVENIVKIKSLITFPIKIRGKMKGTITYLIKEKKIEELTDGNKQLLETYTNQIKIALENSNLFKQEQIIQKNLEEALTELKERRKFEQDMIDVMGHELRTPMSILRNAVSMMDLEIRTKGTIEQDHQKKYVDVAMDAARREIRLIETLLSATKTDAKGFQLLMQNVDLTTVIDSALLANKSEAIKKGLEIKYVPPTTPVVVYGDQLRIQEVADNFLNNAVKYTEKGTIEIKIYQEGERGWISIKDSGVGISEEDQKKLGQKFFRASWFEGRADRTVEEVTKDAAGAHIKPSGTGLGLYVSFNLIKIQDGSFKIESKIGEGSTFSFGIPLYTNQALQQVQKATNQVFESKEVGSQKV